MISKGRSLLIPSSGLERTLAKALLGSVPCTLHGYGHFAAALLKPELLGLSL